MSSKDQSHYRVREATDVAEHVSIDLEDLEAWCRQMLSKAGFEAEHAELVAASLVDAEARGISSHGISRVRIYAERLQGGMLRGDATPTIAKETNASAHVDAANGVGHAGAQFALDTAIDKAKAEGAGVAVVRNSNHCGTLGFFVRQAAEQGLIAIAATNGPPVMVYFGGRARAVGTNPIAFGIPRSDGYPLVLDMATSATARGKIILAGQQGKTIPDGWAVDSAGRPTTDPANALEGAVVPFAGPKGSGLAMMIDLICGGLAAAITGESVGDMYEDWDREQRVSHLIIVLDPNAWVGGDAFRDHVSGFAQRVHGLPPAEGFDQVSLPGEVEEQALAESRENGVTISGPVYADLRDFGESMGVATPEVGSLVASDG